MLRSGLASLFFCAAVSVILPEDIDDSDGAVNLLQVHASKKVSVKAEEGTGERLGHFASFHSFENETHRIEAGTSNWQGCFSGQADARGHSAHWSCDWSGDPHFGRKFHGHGGGDWYPMGVSRMAVERDNEWEVQSFMCNPNGGATWNVAHAVRIGKCPKCSVYEWGNMWFCKNGRCQHGYPVRLNFKDGTHMHGDCLVSPHRDLEIRGTGRGAITVAQNAILPNGQECQGNFANDGRCSYCGNPGQAGRTRINVPNSLFSHAFLEKATQVCATCQNFGPACRNVGGGNQDNNGDGFGGGMTIDEICAKTDRKVEDAKRSCGNMEPWPIFYDDCMIDYCSGITEPGPWITDLIDDECDEEPGDLEGWPHHHGNNPTTTTMDPANYPPEYYLPHCDTVSEPERTPFPLGGAVCEAWAPFWTGGENCDTSGNVLHFDQWSENGGKAGYYQIKLPRPVEINKFTMECERAPAFGIRYSNDGLVWRTAALTRTNKVNPEISWEPQGAYTYWRFEIRSVPGAWRPGPWYKNLRFFENMGPYCQTVIAPHCSAVEPKRFEAGSPGFEGRKCSALAPVWTGGEVCQDGNGDTNKLRFTDWWLKGGFPGWYQMELPRPVLMVGFEVKIAMSPSFKIRYSDDGLCWYDATHRPTKPMANPKIMFGGNAGPHKFWRMEIAGDWAASRNHWYNRMWWYSVTECQWDVPGVCTQAPSFDADDSNAYCEANAHHWVPKTGSNGCDVANGMLRFHPWEGLTPAMAKFGQEAYYQIDFASPKLIAGVTYQTEYSTGHIMHPFQVMCSDDNKVWLPVFEMRTPKMTWPTNQDIEHRWAPVGEKRFWRYQMIANTKHRSNNPNAAYRMWRWQEVEHCLWTTTPTTTTTVPDWKTIPPTTTKDRGNVEVDPNLPLDSEPTCSPSNMHGYFCTALAPHWGPTAEKQKGNCNTEDNNLHFSGWQVRPKNHGGGGGGSQTCRQQQCVAYYQVDTFHPRDFCAFTIRCVQTPKYRIMYSDGGAPGSDPDTWVWKVAVDVGDKQNQRDIGATWESVGKHRYWRYVPYTNSGQWHYDLVFHEHHSYGDKAAPEELCDNDDYDIKVDTLVNNNLGGLGPDFGEEENLRYANVLRRGTQDIDLLVIADGAYTGKGQKNGVSGEGAGSMGVVNVWTGSEVNLIYRFVKSGTSEEFKVDNFLFSVLDMDVGRKGKAQESMTFDVESNGCKRTYLSENSEIRVEGSEFFATTHGTGRDNPDNLRQMDEQQVNRAVVFRCGGVSEMRATFKVAPGRGARNFHFAGATNGGGACPPERNTKTTTTTPGPNCPNPLPSTGKPNKVLTCGMWRDPHVIRNFYGGPAFDQYHEGVVDVLQSRDHSIHVQAFMCDSGAGTTSINAIAVRINGDYISFMRGKKTIGNCDFPCVPNPPPKAEEMWIISVNGHKQDWNAMPRSWPGGTWMLQDKQGIQGVPNNKEGQPICMGDFDRRLSIRVGIERNSKNNKGEIRFFPSFHAMMQEEFVASNGICGTSAGRDDISFVEAIFTIKEISWLCDVCKMRKGADHFNQRGELKSEGCTPPDGFHGAGTPEEVCRQASIPFAEAQEKCKELDKPGQDQFFYFACMEEYCASGGDDVEVELTKEEEHFDDQDGNGDPVPTPPPPAPTPPPKPEPPVEPQPPPTPIFPVIPSPTKPQDVCQWAAKVQLDKIAENKLHEGGEFRFSNVLREKVEGVDLVVTASDNYVALNPHATTRAGQFVQVNMECGREATFFVKMEKDGKPIKMPEVVLSVYDVDEGIAGRGRETATVCDHTRVITVDEPEVLVKHFDDCTSVQSMHRTLKNDNPTDMPLTRSQAKRSADFLLNDKSVAAIHFTLGACRGARNIVFSFQPDVSCFINEHPPKPCDNACVNGDRTGSVKEGNCACQCHEGYEGTACEKEKTCAVWGPDCQGNGQAAGTVPAGDCRCVCDHGFEGEHCEKETPCDGDCSGHGTRTGTIFQDNCACECDEGYEGEACQNAIQCNEENSEQECKNGDFTGTIADDGSNCGCDCHEGFTGNSCGHPVPCPACGNGHSEGSVAEGNCACVCDFAWQGDSCDEKTPCPADMCGEHGDVSGFLADNSCKCTCKDGWSGTRCKTPPACPGCGENGDVTGSTVDDSCGCECHTGWGGDSCENELPCAGECSGNGHSVGTIPAMDCRCVCNHGFTGPQCGHEIPCAQKCSGHGDATGTIAQDNCACECREGYTGDNCENVVQCGEETGHDCHGNGTPKGTVTDEDNEDCSCECNEGWTGTECEHPVPCPACGANGVASGSVAGGDCGCQCDEGWFGDKCDQERPCPDKCNGQGTPTGTIAQGNCGCDCNEGWEGNHCSIEPCPDCFEGEKLGSNKDGSCRCACKKGWVGKLCDEEVPCDSAVCVNGHATGTIAKDNCKCVCDHGFTGDKCNKPVPCANDCSGNGDQIGSVAKDTCACECKEGYTGDSCETAIECSADNGNGCNGNGTPRGTIADDGNDCGCDCNEGWTGNECGHRIPCDECANGMPTGTVAEGNCGCACDDGWAGDNCEKPIPCDDNCGPQGTMTGTVPEGNCECRCAPGWTGAQCRTPPPCPGCGVNGEVTGSFVAGTCGCHCHGGWEGDTCENEKPCVLECSGNGHAVGTIPSENCECICKHGYAGDDCEIELPCINTCSGKGKATGTIAAGNCACECEQGFTGAECENVIECSEDNGNGCNGNGTPRGTIADDGNDCGCDCNEGWIGNECQTPAPCPDVCGDNGMASGSVAQKNCGCTCDEGWDGDVCDEPIPCEDDCNGNGVATGTIPEGNCACECSGGWTGNRCGTPPCPACGENGKTVGSSLDDSCGCKCDQGWQGFLCDEEAPCNGACSGNGHEIGTIPQDNCQCVCSHGFAGDNCENELPCEIDCSGNGEATGTIAQDNCQCECKEGYIGDNCETAVECSENNGNGCNGNGTPRGTIADDGNDCGCDCNEGWQGNECAHPTPCPACGANGRPTGSVAEGTCACACDDGWTGQQCQTEIECEDDCNGNGQITGTIAQNNCECVCEEDWEGPRCGRPVTTTTTTTTTVVQIRPPVPPPEDPTEACDWATEIDLSKGAFRNDLTLPGGSMRFADVMTGEGFENTVLIVEPDENYPNAVGNPAANKAMGQFVQLNLRCGEKATFTVRLEKEGVPISIPEVVLSVYDVDEGNFARGRETVTVCDHVKTVVTEPNQVQRVDEGACTHMTSTQKGTGKDNPKELPLSELQAMRSGDFLFTDCGSATIGFELAPCNGGARNILFAFQPAVSCWLRENPQ